MAFSGQWITPMSASVTSKPDPYDVLRRALQETGASESTKRKAETIIAEREAKEKEDSAHRANDE